MTNAALQLVPFHGQHIEAVRGPDGAPWVVVKRICENLGIDHDSQRQKLTAQPWATTVMITAVGADGRQREMLCCDLETLPMWLVSIDASKVRPSAHAALVAYQREAKRVLAAYFLGQTVATPPPRPSAPLAELKDLIRDTITTELARQGRRAAAQTEQSAPAWASALETEIIRLKRRLAAVEQGKPPPRASQRNGAPSSTVRDDIILCLSTRPTGATADEVAAVVRRHPQRTKNELRAMVDEGILSKEFHGRALCYLLRNPPDLSN